MIFFVTGIDTGIGKTFVTGAMARYLVEKQARVITQKMVQTGNCGYSEDLDLHRALMRVGSFPEDREGLTAPEIFKYPASPHLAAELEQREVDLDKISSSARELDRRYDFVLVEGAGGAAVPLTKELLAADFVAEQKWPVILVTSGRLGSINHTLMSLEMFARRGVEVRALVFNLTPPADAVIAADAQKVMLNGMRRYGFPEILVEMPEVRDQEVFVMPDFSVVFGV